MNSLGLNTAETMISGRAAGQPTATAAPEASLKQQATGDRVAQGGTPRSDVPNPPSDKPGGSKPETPIESRMPAALMDVLGGKSWSEEAKNEWIDAARFASQQPGADASTVKAYLQSLADQLNAAARQYAHMMGEKDVPHVSISNFSSLYGDRGFGPDHVDTTFFAVLSPTSKQTDIDAGQRAAHYWYNHHSWKAPANIERIGTLSKPTDGRHQG